jgi:hypothetical protein
MCACGSANHKFIQATEKMNLYTTGRRNNEELVLDALDFFDEIIEEENPWLSDDETDEDSL